MVTVWGEAYVNELDCGNHNIYVHHNIVLYTVDIQISIITSKKLGEKDWLNNKKIWELVAKMCGP